MYLLPIEEAHLCPVRAMGEWIKTSGITSGYMFRKMSSNDRPSAKDETPLVRASNTKMFLFFKFLYRPQSNSWRCFITTCLTLGLILHLTVPTHFDAAAVSILHLTDAGPCDAFVSGVDGARSSPI